MVKTAKSISYHKSAGSKNNTQGSELTHRHCLLMAISNSAMHTVAQTQMGTCPLHCAHKYNTVHHTGA